MAAFFSCVIMSAARAEDAPRPPMEAVHAAPLYLVASNDRMRMQVPYVGPAGVPTVVSDTIPAGTLLAGNLLGGLVVAGIEHERLKEARASVQPAYDLLRDQRCLLDGSADFMDALEPVAANGAPPRVARHVLTDKQSLDDVVAASDERHMLLISYALTPDLGYLLTTVQVMYAPAGTQGKDSRVTWAGQITVSTAAADLPVKTPEDVERLVAEERRQWAASGNAELVQAANAGDTRARRKVANKNKQYQENLKEARAPEWSLRHASVEHARMWVANDCGQLRGAIQANATQAAVLLSRLYADDLQPYPKQGFWKMSVAEETRDDMTIRAFAPMAWLSWPAGRVAPGRYPSSAWMPDGNMDDVDGEGND